jgi:hypothetical protein
MIEWKKARKKPVVIDFRDVEPNGYWIKDGYGWISDGWRNLGDNYEADEGFERIPMEKIETLEGTHYAIPEIDWVIKGIRGELYPIKKDIFNQTYEELN